jgi:hypothetical protein
MTISTKDLNYFDYNLKWEEPMPDSTAVPQNPSTNCSLVCPLGLNEIAEWLILGDCEVDDSQ